VKDGEPGEWSPVWKFTTTEEEPVTPPAAPSLASPGDGSSDLATDPTLAWNATDDAESYHVQVTADAEFNDLVADEDGLSGEEFQPNGLNYETTYYWRVRAENDGGYSGWSVVWSLQLKMNLQNHRPGPHLFHQMMVQAASPQI
jgi:hypothetical protein